jgi:hypothetical protein
MSSNKHYGFKALFEAEQEKEKRRQQPEPKDQEPAPEPVPAKESRSADQASQDRPDPESLLKSSSLPIPEPEAYPKSSLTESSSLIKMNSHTEMSRLPVSSSLPVSSNLPGNSLWRSIEPARGYTRVPNVIYDALFRLLDNSEQAIYTQLYRLSWGHGKDTCNIGLDGLKDRSNLGKATTQRAIERLEEKGLIEKTGYTFGRGKEQGTQYRLSLPEWMVELIRLPKTSSLPNASRLPDSSRLPKTSTNKDLKENKDKNTEAFKRIIEHFRSSRAGDPNYTRVDLQRDVYSACADSHVVFDAEVFDAEVFDQYVPRK